MHEEASTELSKILSKIMQSSYKRKEIGEIVERIMDKVGRAVASRYDDAEIQSLRLEFEEIRRSFYELQ